MTIISSGPLIGPVLASIRGAAGVTQQELAERTGVAAAQISTYENSRKVPDLDIVARLLKGLNHRLCVLPAGHAIGQRERQAVIDAAVHVTDNTTEPFNERLARLCAAVVALPTHADLPSSNPYAEIAELRTRLQQAHSRIDALRGLITSTRTILREESEL